MASKRWSWLAGLAVLFAGLTNAHAHVHYCFDGQEPPAAVHLADGMDHHHEAPAHAHDGPDHHPTAHHDATEHGTGEHDDLDLDVPNEAIAKVVKHDLAAIDGLAWTMPIESLPRSSLSDSVDSAPYSNPRYALPQQRAPPR